MYQSAVLTVSERGISAKSFIMTYHGLPSNKTRDIMWYYTAPIIHPFRTPQDPVLCFVLELLEMTEWSVQSRMLSTNKNRILSLSWSAKEDFKVKIHTTVWKTREIRANVTDPVYILVGLAAEMWKCEYNACLMQSRCVYHTSISSLQVL